MRTQSGPGLQCLAAHGAHMQRAELHGAGGPTPVLAQVALKSYAGWEGGRALSRIVHNIIGLVRIYSDVYPNDALPYRRLAISRAILTLQAATWNNFVEI